MNGDGFADALVANAGHYQAGDGGALRRSRRAGRTFVADPPEEISTIRSVKQKRRRGNHRERTRRLHHLGTGYRSGLRLLWRGQLPEGHMPDGRGVSVGGSTPLRNNVNNPERKT